MFRFAFFVCTCFAIVMGAGLIPKPTAENFSEFSMPEISLPEQPALLEEFAEISIDLPEMGKRFEERLTQLIPRPSKDVKSSNKVRSSAEAPQLPVPSEKTDVAVSAASIAHTVTFDLNEANLDAQAQAQLDEFVAWLAANPKHDLQIFGHTDLTGPEPYNDALGKSRAEQVASYLIAKGISSERISLVKSYGETRPLIATEETLRENRRVKVATVQNS